MSYFMELPLELRREIMGYIVVFDKVSVTRKQLRAHRDRPALRFVSQFMLTFKSAHTADEYFKILEEYILRHKQVIRVFVTNYDFDNFKAFLGELEQLDEKRGFDAMAGFHFTPDWTHLR